MDASNLTTLFQAGFFETVLDNMDTSVVVTDESFLVQYWNNKAEAVFGHLAVETIGQPVDTFLALSAQNNGRTWKQKLTNEGKWKEKLFYQGERGQSMLLEARGTVVKKKSGGIGGYVLYFRDVTDADKAKTGLATFLSFISSVEDTYFIVDHDLKVAFADEKPSFRMQSIYGFTYAAGDHIVDKLPESRRAIVRDCYRRALEGEKSAYEVNVETIDKKNRWLQVSYFPIRDSTGLVTHACSIIRDITAHKEAELMNERLYESRKLFETFMENSPILAWITDKNGVIRYLNLAYMDTYGLEKTDVGKNWKDLLPADVAQTFYENDGIVFSSGEVLHITERSVTPDGEEHIYQVFKFPIVNDEETLVGGWAIDITEELGLRRSVDSSLKKLQKSERELKEALDKEHQLNEMKSRFVSMASHEFRTPLSTILSSISLLEKYTTTEQQTNRMKHVGKIRESVQHMNALLEDFLSIGKLEEGKILLHSVTIQLPELVTDVAAELAYLKKNGQEVVVKHKGNEAIVTDKKLLKNILSNLLSNAFKFSPENKSVRLFTEATAKALTVVVEDKGIGISRADQEHLFETFYRAKNAQNIQGTGLGLHIVKSYAELLHGDVQLHSEIGIGTTVTLTIPLRGDKP